MEELTPFLEKLAEKLGTTVEHLWGVLLQQVAVEKLLCELWMDIGIWGGIIMCSLGTILFIWGTARNIKHPGAYDDNGVGTSFTGIVLLLVGLLAGGGIYYCNYSELLTLNNNPEYWALKEILGVFR